MLSNREDDSEYYLEFEEATTDPTTKIIIENAITSSSEFHVTMPLSRHRRLQKNGCLITLIDTPGFDNVTDTKMVKTLLHENEVPCFVLFLVDINSPDGATVQNIEFLNIFKEQSDGTHTVLPVFTKL